MKNKKIDKVIEAFRYYISLKEEGAPTMSVGATGQTAFGYNVKTETPPVFGRKKGESNKYIYLKGLRRWWRQNTQ